MRFIRMGTQGLPIVNEVILRIEELEGENSVAERKGSQLLKQMQAALGSSQKHPYLFLPWSPKLQFHRRISIQSGRQRS